MKAKKDIYLSIIAKLTTISLFVLILCLSIDPENQNKDYHPRNNLTQHVIIFDSKPGHEVIVYPSGFTITIASCEISTLNTCNNDHFRILFSSLIAQQQLKKCIQQFIAIKPQIFDFDSFHIIPPPSEEIPLIS
jgi:hypothetical protein